MKLYDVYPLFDINIVKGKGCKVWDDKGFKNADIQIVQRDDVSQKNQVILDVIIDKKEKMKVRKIFILGCLALMASEVKAQDKKDLFNPVNYAVISQTIAPDARGGGLGDVGAATAPAGW